jgi:hypothetical protein
MNRDKQVCLVLVGNLGTTIQFDEAIRLTGIYDADVRTVALDKPAKGESKLQGEILLTRDGTTCPGIVSPMPGINNEREILANSLVGYCDTN